MRDATRPRHAQTSPSSFNSSSFAIPSRYSTAAISATSRKSCVLEAQFGRLNLRCLVQRIIPQMVPAGELCVERRPDLRDSLVTRREPPLGVIHKPVSLLLDRGLLSAGRLSRRLLNEAERCK